LLGRPHHGTVLAAFPHTALQKEELLQPDV
jgi:hypothetical protein